MDSKNFGVICGRRKLSRGEYDTNSCPFRLDFWHKVSGVFANQSVSDLEVFRWCSTIDHVLPCAGGGLNVSESSDEILLSTFAADWGRGGCYL